MKIRALTHYVHWLADVHSAVFVGKQGNKVRTIKT